MPPSGPRSSWWRTPITSADCSIAFSIAFSTTSVTGAAVAPSGTSSGVAYSSPVAGRRAPARRQPARHQQHLHARLVERGEHLARARRRRGRRCRRPAASRSSASRSRLRACSSILSPAHARTRPAPEFSTSQETRPASRSRRYGCSFASRSPTELLRRADQQAVEAAALVEGERDLGGVREVVLDLLLDAALVVGLRPAALVVPAVDVVLDAVGLLELVARRR